MKKIFPYFFGLYAFIFSLIVLPFYTSGDQTYYIMAYDGMNGLDFTNAFIHFKNTLGSSEPVVFLLYYITSKFLDKVLFISFSNAVLGYCVGYFISKSKASPWVYPLFFLNFYFLVLLFSAERLKFGVIFLGFYLIAKKHKNIFAIISFLSHSQVLILYSSIILSKFSGKISAAAKKIIGIKSFIYFVIAFSIVYFFLGEHISAKLAIYSSTESPLERGFPATIRPLIFIALSLFYCKGYYEKAFILGLPMVIAAYFLGSERISIFSYLAFVYFSINFRQGVNAGVLLTSIYFSYQGLDFIKKIFEYGNGFYGI